MNRADELLIAILVIAVLVTGIRLLAPGPAAPLPASQTPCEPTPVEVASYDGHHFVVVMGSAYKVTRIPGGEWEIVGKLERFK